MEKIFIETKYPDCAKLDEDDISGLSEPVAVVGTVQYLDCVRKIFEQIGSAGKKAVLPRLMHAKYDGQVLGCSVAEIEGAGSIIYVGDGMFHPIALQIKNKCDIFTFNPRSRAFLRLDPGFSEKHEKRVKGAVLKFLSSKVVGILVSMKPGQNRQAEAERLAEKLRSKEIEVYMLVFDTLDIPGLLNFPFVECFVNTACPRIFYDEYEKLPRPVVNIDDVKDL